MSIAIGIDVGTYNSAAAHAAGRDRIVMVRSRYGTTGGGKNFPSFVLFYPSGAKCMVGRLARTQGLEGDPALLVWGVKRLVGLSYEEAWKGGELQRFHYRIEEGKDSGILIRVGSRRYTPSDMMEFIFREIKEDAEDPGINGHIGRPIRKAAVSVPAYFSEARKDLILEAARRAGFSEVMKIAEPQAAAESYGVEIDQEAKVLVFDIGAGTLDVAVVRIVRDARGELVTEESCTSGHEALGGIDMDSLFTNYIIDRYALSNVVRDIALMTALREEVEQAKIRLSLSETVSLDLPARETIDVSRREMEEVLKPLLDKCRAPIKSALKKARFAAKDLDHLLFVGGPTHMPCVRSLVRDELKALGAGKGLMAELEAMEERAVPVRQGRLLDPMNCVAQGAALIAARMGTDIDEDAAVEPAKRDRHEKPASVSLETTPVEIEVPQRAARETETGPRGLGNILGPLARAMAKILHRPGFWKGVGYACALFLCGFWLLRLFFGLQEAAKKKETAFRPSEPRLAALRPLPEREVIIPPVIKEATKPVEPDRGKERREAPAAPVPEAPAAPPAVPVQEPSPAAQEKDAGFPPVPGPMGGIPHAPPAKAQDVPEKVTELQEAAGQISKPRSPREQPEAVRPPLTGRREALAKGPDGGTALMRAAESGDVEMTRTLVEKGADVNARDTDKKTALMRAAERGYAEVAKILLSKRAEVNAKDDDRKTALMRAAEGGHAETVQELLGKGADIKARTYYEQDALMYAVDNGHADVVRALLEKGASKDTKDNFGKTVLMTAAGNGNAEVVRLLLEKGASVNMKNFYGKTALIFAAEDGHTGVVRILLAKGAQPDAKCSLNNWTALDYAVNKGYTDIIELLKKKR